MTRHENRFLLTILALVFLPCGSYAREPTVSSRTIARISAGFEHCVSTRREQAPACPMRNHAQTARVVPPVGIPNGVFYLLARELDAVAAANYDGLESPAAWCAHPGTRWAGGIHALCALGSFEQRNFELLTTRQSGNGVLAYPPLRISVEGVASYLHHISEARLQGGFTQLSAAAMRAADKASADIDAGYRGWFSGVQAQAAFVGERLEQAVLAVANVCPGPSVDGGCDGGRMNLIHGPSRFDVLTTFAELGAPAFQPVDEVPRAKGQKVSFPARRKAPSGELLVTVWAAQAADEQRRRVHHLISAAQLTEDRELINAASEYAAAAMSQVTERAAQCALLCMEEAGLGDSIPVPLPIAADLTIPMTFVR